MPKQLEQLGKKIAELRGDESRADFGAKLTPKVTADAVGKWERGETNIPFTVLCDIAAVKGISVADLFSSQKPKAAAPREPSQKEMALAILKKIGLERPALDVIELVLDDAGFFEAVQALAKGHRGELSTIKKSKPGAG